MQYGNFTSTISPCILFRRAGFRVHVNSYSAHGIVASTTVVDTRQYTPSPPRASAGRAPCRPGRVPRSPGPRPPSPRAPPDPSRPDPHRRHPAPASVPRLRAHKEGRRNHSFSSELVRTVVVHSASRKNTAPIGGSVSMLPSTSAPGSSGTLPSGRIDGASPLISSSSASSAVAVNAQTRN
jgi:hypothetical protein